MQRDTHLTFGEIYPNREELLVDVEKIMDIALVEVTNEPLQLRFIIPSCPIYEWYTDPTVLDYQITRPEEHTPGMDYVSVSYCWKHSQSLDGLPPIPEYRITDSTGLVRVVRCAPIIFHRAIEFARYYRCPYIWIDQECIHQDNPQDIEQHLRIMDRVYSESRYTAAMLSYNIDTAEKVDALIDFVYGEWDYHNLVDRPLGTKTLVELTNDPWFRRTWAFQEKNCAAALFLLIPISPTTSSTLSSQYVVAGDLHIKLSSLQCHLSTKYGLFRDAHASSCDEHTSMSRTDVNTMKLYATQAWYAEDINSYEIAKTADTCDNLLVADRVSIIGNVHKFKWRLLSSRLDTGKWGLSVCLLALHVANMYCGRSKEGRRRYLVEGRGKKVMELKFVEAAEGFLGYRWMFVREGEVENVDGSFRIRRNSE